MCTFRYSGRSYCATRNKRRNTSNEEQPARECKTPGKWSKSVNFETATQYLGSRLSLWSLKTHLQCVKCSSTLEWERQGPRVPKEVLHSTWTFAERSQVAIIERKDLIDTDW